MRPASGQCACRAGFAGRACGPRLPRGGDNSECSGHGRCLPLGTLAALADDGQGDAGDFAYGVASRAINARTPEWYRDVIHGCLCDGPDVASHARETPKGLVVSGVSVDPSARLGGWHGYDCTKRSCPRGDDPITPGESEKQVLWCNATRSFKLTFRQRTTAAVPANATVAELEAALEAIATLGDVVINRSATARACSETEPGLPLGITFISEVGVASLRFPPRPLRPFSRAHARPRARPTFPSQLGDLPPLVAKPYMRVAEAVKGTRENAVCSNRGYSTRTPGAVPRGLRRGSDAHGRAVSGATAGTRTRTGSPSNPYYQ